MLVGLLFCAVFVVISFFAREQPENTYVLKKADRLVRSAGSAVPFQPRRILILIDAAVSP